MVELIGLFGSAALLVSMLFQSSTYKGNIKMRLWNIAGSVLLLVYGILIHSISNILLNVIMVIVHIYHIVVLVKEGDNNESKC